MTRWYENIDDVLKENDRSSEHRSKETTPSVSVLKSLYEMHTRGESWLSTVPKEISDAFFDNPLTDSLQEQINFMIEVYFGIHSDAAEWLLFEWHEGMEVGVGGEYFIIDTPEDYYKYLIDHEGWKK